MQLGPWGLVHHQKACTLRIDYVNNGRLHTKYTIVCKICEVYTQKLQWFALQNLINLRNCVLLYRTSP